MRFIYTKTFAAFAASLTIIVLLAFMQSKGWLNTVEQGFLQAPRPVAAFSRALARPFKNFFTTIYDLRKISKDNKALNDRLVELSQQTADYDQLKRENQALRQELGFIETVKFSLVPCTVLSQNPFGLTDTLVLNCGKNQGIKEGQAVLSQGYLVAKIVFVGKDNSTALLATDSKFSADAQLSKTGATGLVNGSFGSGLVLDRLSQNDQIDKGWQVITAGINDLIPKGILIGQVGDVISSGNDLFKKTTLLTPVDFSDINFVFVAKQ